MEVKQVGKWEDEWRTKIERQGSTEDDGLILVGGHKGDRKGEAVKVNNSCDYFVDGGSFVCLRKRGDEAESKGDNSGEKQDVLGKKQAKLQQPGGVKGVGTDVRKGACKFNKENVVQNMEKINDGLEGTVINEFIKNSNKSDVGKVKMLKKVFELGEISKEDGSVNVLKGISGNQIVDTRMICKDKDSFTSVEMKNWFRQVAIRQVADKDSFTSVEMKNWFRQVAIRQVAIKHEVKGIG